MDISLRPLRVDDVEAAFRRAGYPFSFSPQVRACVPEVWRLWLQRGSLYGTVFLDHARPKPEIVGLAAIAFLTDDAYRAATENPCRLLGKQPPRLEAEQRADLLFFRFEGGADEPFRMVGTLVGGRWSEADAALPPPVGWLATA